MKSCICFRSLLNIVGGSPTSLPAYACGVGMGGGPHPPPGGLAPGGPPPPPRYPPPPGNPPPPLGNPPPLGYPPPGNPLPGQSSWGSLIGGNSGSLSGPTLGGSALSGPVACHSAASSSTMFAIHLIWCPVCSLIVSSASLPLNSLSSFMICSLAISVIIVMTGGLIWIDSASSTSLSSSIVFPGAPNSMVCLEPSLCCCSSWLSAVEGAGVLGVM